MTTARQEIWDVLLRSGGHITAYDLVQLVHQTSPGIGRMTVYRTLDILCQVGLIRPVYQGTGAAHYVLMDHGHHHHFICSGCGIVIEVEDCFLAENGKISTGRFKFQVHSHLLEFYGLCQDCQ